MFLVHLATSRSPIFSLAMLKDRNLASGTLFMFIISIVMMSAMASGCWVVPRTSTGKPLKYVLQEEGCTPGTWDMEKSGIVPARRGRA